MSSGLIVKLEEFRVTSTSLHLLAIFPILDQINLIIREKLSLNQSLEILQWWIYLPFQC